MLFPAHVAGSEAWIETEPATVTLECAPSVAAPEASEEVAPLPPEPEPVAADSAAAPVVTAEPLTPDIYVVGGESSPDAVEAAEPPDLATAPPPSSGGGCASARSPAIGWVTVLLFVAAALYSASTRGSPARRRSARTSAVSHRTPSRSA